MTQVAESGKDSLTNNSCAVASRFCPAHICWYVNFAIKTYLVIYFFVIPFCLMVYYLADPAIQDKQIPRMAIDLHQSLSPKFAEWAQGRVKSGQAEKLSVNDIAGTEWPVFGSAFFLWATQSLQDEWEEGASLSSAEPKVYAADAIRAATALIIDPGHASWVKQHWGEEYLQRENVFYRMLVITALTSYEKMIGDGKYLPFLLEQVESLSKELDESPYGLLDDYPGQCFPSDVIAAIVSIKRADEVLGTDHTDFVQRSIRGFENNLVDAYGLVPYMANSDKGHAGVSRGCTCQWSTVWSAELWPEYSKEMFTSFVKNYWQQRWTAVGFREFPLDETGKDWYFDVDAGPVVAGHGVSASAFGIGAAIANGSFEHAYPLTAEAIVLSWPLPRGVLALPRILSNVAHAPYTGEMSVLFALTRRPAKGISITTGGKLPRFVYLMLSLHLTISIALTVTLLVRFKRKRFLQKDFRFERTQLVIWALFVITGILICLNYNCAIGFLLILLAQLFPRGVIKNAV